MFCGGSFLGNDDVAESTTDACKGIDMNDMYKGGARVSKQEQIEFGQEQQLTEHVRTVKPLQPEEGEL